MVKVQNRLYRLQQMISTFFYSGMRLILSLGIGFISARCSLFDDLSPFSLILLSVSPDIGLIPTFCYLGSALGYLTDFFSLSVFKYITALTMIYTAYMVFRKSLHIIKNDTAVLTGACCFTAGFIFLLAGDFGLFSLLVLVAESLLVCCSIYFVGYAAKAFRKSCYLTTRELIAAAVTMILFLAAFHDFSIFRMNISRIIAFALLFLAVSCLKTSHTAVLGTCLGIILAAIGDGGEAIFTAMIVGTLTSCMFSAFSDRLAISAFILAYYVVLIFFGKFPWNYWYFSEPMIAYALIFFIPKTKLRRLLSSYIAVRAAKSPKTAEKSAQKLMSACKRECRQFCPKATDCYHTNAAELYEALEGIKERYKETESLDHVEEALPFCIKPHAMKKIIEKKIIGEYSGSYDELVEQLEHLSKQLDIKMNTNVQSVYFFDEEEKAIRSSLEKRRITVKDINIITDDFGCKKGEIHFSPNGDILYQKIIQEVAAPYFGGGCVLQYEQSEGHYCAHIKESSNYRISCAALCKTKGGEEICGDSALGFSVGKDHYYLLLADGMGSGKEANLQSSLIIDTLRKLISGGLSVPNALNVYRSVARFRQDSCFTTIDICAIDLKNGTADFYKAGAYDSYYLHHDQVSVLHGGGMPLGLSEHEKLRHIGIKFTDGDYLILASDGLTVLNEHLEETIQKNLNEDVRLFARNILRDLAGSGENSSGDDVTLMVCKLRKTAE